MKIQLTPFWWRIIAYIIAAIIIIVAFRFWLSGRDDRLATKASAEQGVRTDVAASGIAEDASAIADDTEARETVVSESRITYHHVYEEAKRNEPELASWARTPTPQRMLDLARARRESRERLGCVGAGCQDDDQAPGAGRDNQNP